MPIVDQYAAAERLLGDMKRRGTPDPERVPEPELSTGPCNRRHAVQWLCSDPACYRFDDFEIGARVQRQRTHLGLTQQELAERVNEMQGPRKGARVGDREGLCSAQYISDLERGRRMPGLRRARALADALGVRLDYLAGRDHHNGARFPSRP